MSASILPTLIEKYLYQSLSHEEAIQLESLLQNEENLRYFKNSIQNIYLLKTENFNVDANAAYLKVDALISKNRKVRKNKRLIVLASIFLLISLLLTFFLIKDNASDKEHKPLPPTINVASLQTESGKTYKLPIFGIDTLRNAKNDKVLAIINNGTLTYLTHSESIESHRLVVPNGTTYNVRLSDGSKVKLNSGSEMSYLSDFEDAKVRDIAFQGEAFFDVARNESKPFMITSGEHLVEVLGTKFNLSAYPDDAEIITTLEHGSVKISEKSNQGNAVILKPGDRFVWKEGININTKEPSKSEMPKWIKGELNFEDTTFEEASTRLERAFDVEIIIKSKEVKSYRFTGTFKPESIEKILSYLQEAYEFDYSIENRIVEIY